MSPDLTSGSPLPSRSSVHVTSESSYGWPCRILSGLSPKITTVGRTTSGAVVTFMDTIAESDAAPSSRTVNSMWCVRSPSAARGVHEKFPVAGSMASSPMTVLLWENVSSFGGRSASLASIANDIAEPVAASNPARCWAPSKRWGPTPVMRGGSFTSSAATVMRLYPVCPSRPSAASTIVYECPGPP